MTRFIAGTKVRGTGQCTVVENGVRCTRVLECRGMCQLHYGRFRRYGSTERRWPTLEERFWSKVDKSGGPDACWLWTASCNDKGYGQFQMGGHSGRPHAASRVALILSGVEVADDQYVNHHCDNKPCCNPRHLYAGSPKDNVRDMAERGQMAVGIRHPLSKLSEDDVRQIRRLIGSGSLSAIGRHFGVTPEVIRKIRDGRSWKHVA